MRNSSKSYFLLFVFSALAVGVTAQSGIPEKPHRVFGDVTDDGQEAENIDVEFRYDGSIVAEDTTNSNGYYDVSIPYSSSYSDENISLFINDSDTEEDIVFSSGESESLDNSGNYIQKDSEDPDPSDSSGGSDSSSGSSEGGGALPPSDDEPEPKQVDAEVDPETSQASAQVDQVEENQQVQVNIPDTEEAKSTIEQVSFTSSSSSDSISVSVSDLGKDRPETVEEDAGSDVYSYQQISVEGVEDEDITESNVNFKVQKSFLNEKGRSPEDVVMKRYNNNQWQELDTRIDEELDNSYRFEASSTGFSYYAIALQEQENETQGEPNIQTSSLNVQPSEGTPPFDVTIDVTVENTGDAEGSQEVEVTLEDEVIKSETVSLEAGEERTLSYNYTVERSGSQLSFSAGNQSTTVEASQKGTSMLPVAVALLIVAILGVVGYTQRETIRSKVEDFRE